MQNYYVHSKGDPLVNKDFRSSQDSHIGIFTAQDRHPPTQGA